MGGFHWARLWHFVVMWAMLAFVFRTFDYGGSARLEQFRFDADGLEEGSRVLTRRGRWRKPMWS